MIAPVIPAAPAADLAPPAWLRTLAWRRPEWWLLVLAAASGALLALSAALPEPFALCSAGRTAILGGAVTRLAALASSGALGRMAAGSLLMSAAMMLPLLILPARHVACRSLWRRRHRAIAVMTLGYLGLWTLATLAAAATLAVLVPAKLDASPWPGAFGLLIAAAWQLTPAKRAALLTCHRSVPLAPDGWRADASCLGYGVSLGGRCLVSCWALMLCPILGGQSLILMAGAGALAFAERIRLQPPLVRSAVILAAAAPLWLIATWRPL